MLRADESLTRLLQRIVPACVMFPHGDQKLFGWFGGPVTTPRSTRNVGRKLTQQA